MEITLEMIPTWLVSAVMLFTGWMWLITRKREVRMDSRIVAYTLLLQGISYLLNSVFADPTNIERVIGLRLIIILICLAQSIPLTVSYVRILKREKDFNQGMK